MRPVLALAQIRAADAAAARATGEGALIERAAAAVAVTALRLLGRGYGAQIVVLAGSGHNGADALRAGARLARRGAAVLALASGSSAGDGHVTGAWADLLAAGGRRGAALPARCDLVIDGMAGAGLRGGLTGAAAALAQQLAGLVDRDGARSRVLAVDLPSGVSADTGAVTGPAVRADATVTFGALKAAHVVGEAAERCGEVVVADIGLGDAGPAVLGVLDADDVAPLLADPASTADKYRRGVVGVRAGSAAYPGAAVLCVGGAVRAGAGYVRYAGAAGDAVRASWPTAVVGPGRVDVEVVGPGFDDLDAVREVLDGPVPAVLDAGALTVGAAAIRGRPAPTLLTPHAGEFARLTGVDPAADPLGAARDAARDLGVHVLLKGRRTVVAAPDGRALINPTGTSWLSTAGTGDVLAGAAGALIAAAAKRGELDLLTVAAAAAFLHGLAGRYAPVPLAASDLLAGWHRAVAAVRSGG